MRSYLLLFCLCLAFCLNAQRNNEMSFNGMGELRLGMSKAEVEKLLNTKLTLRHIGIDDELEDTFNVKYKGMNMQIFMKEAYDDSTDVAILKKVHTKNATIKTSGGLGIGNDWLKIINGLPGYTVHVERDYDKYPVRSKTRSTIIVTNADNEHVMLFRLLNKKVVALEVNDYHDFY